ncbi:hypothetical protein F4818DRAFT_454482 [Hypoxylon cercidicola]|nr:hypothetical protein F4818DRAFT_454482 [Hypoxylon cercidicola]
MGNILGTPRPFYISYDWDGSFDDYADTNYSSSYDTSYGESYDESGAPYDWSQSFSELLCCPCCGGAWDYEQEEDSGWDAAVVGFVRRKDCRNRDHWALAFGPEVDISQLPGRIDGFRTFIPDRCRRTCRSRHVYGDS